jgi:DNA-binding NtrC family response regulator
MAKILIYEPEPHSRDLMRYLLEGINNRVSEAPAPEDIPRRLFQERTDLLILGVHPEEEENPLLRPEWQLSLPEIPILMVFSGASAVREGFLSSWHGPAYLNLLSQPVEPYPLLAMVKSMLTAPEIWRKGGQHMV